jgi:hypothetical protein
MSDDTQAQAPKPGELDPQFFTVCNEYLELTNRQSKEHGLKRISMASLYAAARFNAHVFLSNAGSDAPKERTAFLDYMTDLYRRMLNEHLDGLGHDRNIDVGVSELEADYARVRAENEAAAAAAAANKA